MPVTSEEGVRIGRGFRAAASIGLPAESTMDAVVSCVADEPNRPFVPEDSHPASHTRQAAATRALDTPILFTRTAMGFHDLVPDH